LEFEKIACGIAYWRAKSRPQTAFDNYRQTRSAANVEEVEQSKDEALINEHMPQYITKAPWYINQVGKPSLKHQRASDDHKKTPLDKWYKRGVSKAKKITKYRKGACKNCGAITHDSKFCMDRPRKVGAKHSGKNFGYDDEVQDMGDLTFEAKMDRWNGLWKV
jgi:pre-mRNA-processing factor SLU7